jgi:hypothetical protein
VNGGQIRELIASGLKRHESDGPLTGPGGRFRGGKNVLGFNKMKDDDQIANLLNVAFSHVEESV